MVNLNTSDSNPQPDEDGLVWLSADQLPDPWAHLAAAPTAPPKTPDPRILALPKFQANVPQKHTASNNPSQGVGAAGQPEGIAEQFQPIPDQPRSLTELGLTVLRNGLLLAKSFCGTFGSSKILTDPANVDKAEGLAFFAAEILDWRTDKLMAIMGLINRLVYCQAIRDQYLRKDPEGFGAEKVKYSLDKKRFRAKVTNANPVMVAIVGIQEYLAEYWGVSCCRRSIARWGRDLEKLNLVTLHTVGGQGKQSALWQLNLPGLLLMAEAIEGELKHREAESPGSLDMLPDHNANTLRRLSNALFQKAKEWCRKLGSDVDPLPLYRDGWDAAAEVAYVAVSNAFELFGAPVPDWFCPRDLAYEF